MQYILASAADTTEADSGHRKPTTVRQNLNTLDKNFRDIAQHHILSVAGEGLLSFNILYSTLLFSWGISYIFTDRKAIHFSQ